ncbi:GNAT family N-acetyltransferase [Enterococcus timonensis]|uniref:GNAT family N-acetyltransferase n=1 Tax=Enterococcus timonensis TaxID=1852364 RepID=UPI0008D992D2|nr:GNAT family N-acetyltransferase [Enterococcus timonensis]
MEILLNNEKLNLLIAENARLETSRLILRPITLADVPAIFNYGSKPSNTRYVFPMYHNIEETKLGVANYFIKEPLGKYALELKETGEMIGSIELRINGISGEMGYVLNEDFWGKGLMSEAAEALLILGFETLKLPHMCADCLKENIPSQTVMKKIGMTLEAEIPNERIFEGELATSLQFGITKEKYFGRK